MLLKVRRRFLVSFMVGTVALSILLTRSSAISPGAPGPTLFGAVAWFEVVPSPIARDGILTVVIHIRNTTAERLTWRYYSTMERHLAFIRPDGSRVQFKNGFAIRHGPVFEVDIPPQKSVVVRDGLALGDFLEMTPGRYEVRLLYDLRLMGQENVNEPVVRWSSMSRFVEVR